MTCAGSTSACEGNAEHPRCPACGATGVSVEAITLKALLNAGALRRGVPRLARFCATETCPVVYFDPSGDVAFTENDLVVAVHAKHLVQPDSPVCYCFAYTVGHIEQALARGENLRDDVASEVKAGHCACEVRNPRGACCLGDILRVEQRFSAASAATAR